MTFNGPRLNHALLPHPLHERSASRRDPPASVNSRRAHHYEKKNSIVLSDQPHPLSLSEECKVDTLQRTHGETILSWFNKHPSSTPLLDLHKYHHPLIVGVVSPYHHFIPCNSFPRGQKFWAAKEFSPTSAAAHNFCPRLLLVIIISTNAFMLLKTWILFELLHRLVQHQKTVLVTRWLIN